MVAGQPGDVAHPGKDHRALEFLEQAERAHGAARILVNCAGIAPAAKTVGKENVPHPLDAFTKTIIVNLIGTFNVIAKFAARAAAAAEEIDGEVIRLDGAVRVAPRQEERSEEKRLAESHPQPGRA